MCIVCNRRPRRSGGRYCFSCERDIRDERRDNEARRRWWDKAEYVLVWHEHVVSLVENGDNWHPVYEGMPSVKPVPRDKLINLHDAHPSIDHRTFKRMKGAVRAFMPTA